MVVSELEGRRVDRHDHLIADGRKVIAVIARNIWA